MFRKSWLLSTVAVFARDGEGEEQLTPAAAQAAKDAAKATQRKAVNNTAVEEPKVEGEGEKEVEDKEGETGEGESEGEGEGEGEGETKTPEEIAAAAAAEADAKDVAKLQRTIARLQKRVDKTTAEKAATATELAAARAALAAKPETALTEADVEARSEAKATQKQIERQFTDDCNRLFKEATKENKEFKAQIDELTDDIGKIPGQMIGILADLDNGGAILNYFIREPDEAEEIFGLSLSKMAAQLAKISIKLEDKTKKTVKELSKVPPPLTPPGTQRAGSSTAVITGKETMDEFVTKRNAQIAKRQDERRRGLRS